MIADSDALLLLLGARLSCALACLGYDGAGAMPLAGARYDWSAGDVAQCMMTDSSKQSRS